MPCVSVCCVHWNISSSTLGVPGPARAGRTDPRDSMFARSPRDANKAMLRGVASAHRRKRPTWRVRIGCRNLDLLNQLSLEKRAAKP